MLFNDLIKKSGGEGDDMEGALRLCGREIESSSTASVACHHPRFEQILTLQTLAARGGVDSYLSPWLRSNETTPNNKKQRRRVESTAQKTKRAKNTARISVLTDCSQKL